MKLTPAQLERFDRDGYLFFPEPVHASRDRGRSTDEVPALYAQRRPENVREKTRRRGAHELRRPHVQRALRPARAPPAHGASR